MADTDEYEDEPHLHMTFGEYHFRGLCLFPSQPHNQIFPPTAQPACYFAGSKKKKKRRSICFLTPLKQCSKSQLTLNGLKWHTQMFNVVRPSDVQCFISP